MKSGALRILLVEDSPSDAVLLQESLMQNELGNFHFTHAETLAEGIKQLCSRSFDLLMLDLSLPDSAGSDTFLRARAAAPQVPIVVLTSVEDEAVGLEAVKGGVQEYLIKGQAYGRQTARSIRYAIERKRAEEALKQAEAALQREKDQLEERVQQRTAQLSQANQALQAEILQRQRAEKGHRQVLRRLSQAQETERGRISRELHDRLGQDLTALKLGLQILRKQGPFSGAVQESISKLEGLARGLMRDIHRLAWELRPPALDDLGLELALRRYATEWSEASEIPIDFHSAGLEGCRLPPEFETTLYRVAQEALTNVLRHAEAKRVSVLLERRASGVSLILEDDGLGFDCEALMRAPAARGKLGLLGMQERLKLLGGSFEIESAPGTGATLFARIPLDEASAG
ncbi:MAG TPA: histidine kinase [Verrucomicrobiae bacterium]|nr:histidine kinase [Verrucomicrobiae bacterium]